MPDVRRSPRKGFLRKRALCANANARSSTGLSSFRAVQTGVHRTLAPTLRIQTHTKKKQAHPPYISQRECGFGHSLAGCYLGVVLRDPCTLCPRFPHLQLSLERPQPRSVPRARGADWVSRGADRDSQRCRSGQLAVQIEAVGGAESGQWRPDTSHRNRTAQQGCAPTSAWPAFAARANHLGAAAQHLMSARTRHCTCGERRRSC